MICKPIYYKILFSTIILLLFSCNRSNTVNRSFYYWKSVFTLSPKDQEKLSSLSVNTLYVKFFDVIWDKQLSKVTPTAIVLFNTKAPTSISIVPVVYITNETFMNVSMENIDTLSSNILSLLTQITNSQKIKFTELQFDCDWTEKTKDKYFLLLKQIRKKMDKHISISATIRLHQIKYPQKTGVPPVDKGIVMFYNMGELNNPQTQNSIYNDSIAKKYVKYIPQYSLKLDAAIATYSWGAVVRNTKVSNLINDISCSTLDTIPSFQKMSNHIYKVVEPRFFRGIYLFKNDTIRIEDMSPEIAMESATLLRKYFKSTTFNLVLFHFNNSDSVRYEQQDFENLFSAFN